MEIPPPRLYLAKNKFYKRKQSKQVHVMINEDVKVPVLQWESRFSEIITIKADYSPFCDRIYYQHYFYLEAVINRGYFLQHIETTNTCNQCFVVLEGYICMPTWFTLVKIQY